MSSRAFQAFRAFFREAAWLDGQRATAYARILGGLSLLAAVGWATLSLTDPNPAARPLGPDFVSFWAASKLALAGHPEQVYSPAAHAAVQRAVFGGVDTGYAAFFYPPVFLLVCLPLAALPYLASLGAWLAVTGAACWPVIRGWLGRSATMLPALAFPATFYNIGHGQNAFLTTALFGAGGLWLQRRPWLAGACFGALIFKPHLGLLIPIALIAGRQWKAIAGAAATAGALVGLSLLAFGLKTWTGFLAVSGLARATLERGLVPPADMQSAFAAIRLWNGPVPLAYAAQALVGLAAALAVAVVFARRRNDQAAAAALVAATLLATPFLLDYDLMLMAVPLAWLFAEGTRRGFLPWEKTGLVAAFLLPLLSRIVAARTGLPLGPPVLAMLFALVLRRVLARDEDAPSFAPSAAAPAPRTTPSR